MASRLCYAELWPRAQRPWNSFLPRGAVICVPDYIPFFVIPSLFCYWMLVYPVSSGETNLLNNQFTSCQTFCMFKWCYLFFCFSRAQTAMKLNVVISLFLPVQAAEEVRWRQFNQTIWRSIWCPGEAWRRVCVVFQWAQCTFLWEHICVMGVCSVDSDVSLLSCSYFWKICTDIVTVFG